MNKARLAEAGRGFIPKLDAEPVFGRGKLIVDLSISIECSRVMAFNPK